MAESLGDAVLDLTADLHPLAQKIAEARAMVDQGLTGMEQRGQLFDQRYGLVADSLQRNFAQPVENAFLDMARKTGQSLDDLTKSAQDAELRMQALKLATDRMADSADQMGTGMTPMRQSLYGLATAHEALRKELETGIQVSGSNAIQQLNQERRAADDADRALQNIIGTFKAMGDESLQMGGSFDDTKGSVADLLTQNRLLSTALVAQRDRMFDLRQEANRLNEAFGLQDDQVINVANDVDDLTASYSFTVESLSRMSRSLQENTRDVDEATLSTNALAAATNDLTAARARAAARLASRAAFDQPVVAAPADLAPAAGGAGGAGGGVIPPVAISPGGGGGGGNNDHSLLNLLMGAHSGGIGRQWGIGPFRIPRIAGAGLGSLGSFAGFGPEHVLTTVGAVAGSAGTGLAGAGVLGLGALGQAAVGGGSDLAVTASTIADTKTLSQALAEVSKQTQIYGAKSKEAAVATATLKETMSSLGDTAGVKAELGLAKATQALSDLWDKQTSAARVASVAVLDQVVKLGTDYVPLVASAAQKNLTVINSSLMPLFSWLEGPQGVGIFNNLEQNFLTSLPNAVHAFDQAMELLLRVMSLASDHTGGMVEHLDDFFTRLNAKPDGTLSGEIDHLIGQFQLWEHFLGLVGKDLVGIFRNDAGTGSAIIGDLTVMLQKLHEWEDSTSGRSQLKNLFEIHKQEVENLLSLLPTLVSGFSNFYLLVAPAMVNAVTPIIGALSGVLKEIIDLGHQFPIFQSAVVTPLAALLIVSKALTGNFLKGVPEVISRTAGALKGLTAAETENAAAATADAAANAADDAAIKAGGGFSIFGGAAKGGTVAKEATTAGEVAAGGGIASRAVGAVKGAITPANLVRGAGIALAGNLLLSGVEQQFHSGIVDAIGGIGKGAADGAAIGSVFGPEGTIPGALAGGMTAALIKVFSGDEADGQAQKFTSKFFQAQHIKPTDTAAFNFGPQIEAAHAKVLEYTRDIQSLQAAQNPSEQQRQQHVSGFGPTGATTQSTSDQLAKELAQRRAQLAAAHGAEQAAEFAQGKELGKRFVQGMQSVKFPSQWGIVADFEAQAKGLSTTARDQGALSAIKFAEGLVAKKELPKSQLAGMIHDLEQQYPELHDFLVTHGAATALALAEDFKFTKAETNWKIALTDFEDGWVNSHNRVKVTQDNIVATTTAAMDRLKEVMKNGTHDQQVAATAEYKLLQTNAATSFKTMETDVVTKISGMAGAIASGTAGAATAAQTNFSTFSGAVNEAMKGGVLSTSTGAQMIAEAANATLKAMHAPQIPIPELENIAKLGAIVKPITGGVVSGLAGGVVNPGGSTGGRTVLGAATGGWIGAPGEKGRDEVHTILGRGEAVLNHQQQGIVNAGLQRAGIGSLDHVFGMTQGTKHYMTEGGYAGGGLVTASEFGGHNDPSAFNKSTASGKIANDSLWGFAELSNNFGAGTSGNFSALGGLAMGSNITVKYGGKSISVPKVDKGAGGPPIPPATVRAIDLTFAANAALGAPGLENVLWAPGANATIAGDTGAGAAGASLWTDIAAPGVKGGGFQSALVKGVLDNFTKSVNAYGQKQAMLHAPSVTGGGGGPVFPIAPGPIPPQVQWALSAAETIAAKNLPYGHDGAGWGLSAYDCSSYVSTVMDAAGIWPKWTYNTAAGPINAATDPGPGKWITIATRGTSGDNAHTMMEINGRYFESSHTGLGPHEDSGWSERFDQYRHPHGFASGGFALGSMAEGQPGHQPTQAQADILTRGGPAAKALIAQLNPGLKLKGHEMHGGGWVGMDGGGYTDRPLGFASGGTVKPKAKPLTAAEKRRQDQQAKAMAQKVKQSTAAVTAAREKQLPGFGLPNPKNVALPGFDTLYMNGIAQTIDAINDMQNWQSYENDLHGRISVTPTITITNPDGTTTEEINWGDPNPAIPIDVLTGMIDPDSHQQTKSIADRLREIGEQARPTWTPHASPTQELTLDEMMVAGYTWQQHQAVEAQQAYGGPKGWLATMRADLAARKKAVRNTNAMITELTHRRENLAGERADRDDQIAKDFRHDRANVQALSKTGNFNATNWLAQRMTALTTQESDAKAQISHHAPASFLGDPSSWLIARNVETAAIGDEFTDRKAALQAATRKNKFQGQQNKAKALLGLQDAEAAERGDLRREFDAARIGIDQKITDQLRPTLKTQTARQTSDQDAINKAIGPDGFAATLGTYLDPKGQLATSILTVNNIDIPALLLEMATLKATTVEPQQVDNSQALADAQALSALYLTLAQQSAQTAAISARDMLAFNIPEYVGSFATGGVIPGPLGEPKLAVVHGGEEYAGVGKSIGDGHVVHVHIHDGAVDPKKIQVIAENAAVKMTTRMTRGGRQPLPGRGGSGVGLP